MNNFSIIIPHYNIPDLLIRCINSIPIRDDIQVIVVDDCSPDSDRYLKDYPELSRRNLEYYKTPKGGSAGRARNVGLSHAKGKWLMFVDADDLLPQDILSTLDYYLNNSEDLIIMDYKSVMSNDLSKKSERNDFFHDLIKRYLDKKDISILYKYDPMWGKLVKKELVDKHNIKFDETRWSNDGYFSLSIGIHAKSFIVDNRVGYILTQRDGSLASNYCGTIQEMETRLLVALKMKQLLIDNGISNKYSHVGYLNYILSKNFSRKQRLSIAYKFWKYPKYMLLLLRNCFLNN